MRNKIVKVIWKDARTLNSTQSIEEIKKEGLVESISIGYLIDQDSERIAICGFVFPDEDVDRNMHDECRHRIDYTGFRDTHLIPISNIVKMVELTEMRKRKTKTKHGRKKSKNM